MLRIFPYILIWLGGWLLYFPTANLNPVNPVSKKEGKATAVFTKLECHLPPTLMLGSSLPKDWFLQWVGDVPILGQMAWKPWFWGSGAAMMTLALLLLYKDKNDRGSQERSFLQKIRDLEQAALRAQMNPHFIFNALNSIQGFIVEGDKKSSVAYLSKFSTLVRATLNHSAKKEISLEEELSVLRGYLELERLRFHSSFDFEIKVHPSIDTYDASLPPMMVQPFIENAILHGLAPKVGKGLLLIEFQPHQSGLLVIVQDNGIGIEVSKKLKRQQRPNHYSVGMRVTAKRLRLLGNQKDKNKVEVRELVDGFGEVAGTEIRMVISMS